MNEKGYWFISHCSKDIKIVEQIVNVVKDCGIPYWKAPEMIPAGSNYAKEIPKALKNCSIFLFIVSEAAQNSVWIEKELDSAVNARKKIIPVRIDDTPLSDMYTFYMNNIQMIDVQVQADGKIANDSLKMLAMKFKESTPKPNVINNTVLENKKIRPSSVSIENYDNVKKMDAREEIERRRIDNRTNAFRINKIPTFCEQCNMKLEYVDVGTYRCPSCNIDYYDDYKKIKNFIRDNGPAPAYMIARSTGVSKETIEHFFREDIKIIPKSMDLAQSDVTKTGKQIAKDNAGMWRSSIWKK